MGNLEREMELDALLELKPSSAGEFADNRVDAEVLLRELEDGPFPFRKDFCEFLGIGESTLTGWLKAKRIPRTAKVAYALLVGMTVLQDEVRRLRSEAKDLKILKDGEKYLVVRFETDDAGVAIGKIVARDIADAKTARVFAASLRGFRLLEEIYDTEHESWQGAWETGGADWYRDIQTRVLKEIVSTFRPDAWRQLFGPMDPNPSLLTAVEKILEADNADEAESGLANRSEEGASQGDDRREGDR